MNRNKKTLLAGTLSALLLVFGVAARVPLFDLAVHAGSGNAINPLPLVTQDSSLARAERSRLTAFACVNNPVVTTNADSGAGSLRQAISDACTGSTITFDMSPGKVTSPITLTSGELPLSNNLTIQGPGATLLTVSGNNNSRVFNVNVSSPGAVTFTGLTISNGKAQDSSGGGINNNNTGTINLANSTISGNSSPGFGVGGGIGNNTGTINVTNSTISGNSANFGGGIENNDAGAIVVTNSTLSGNSANQGGGGIFNFVANGTINVTNSTLSGNSAGGFGGGGILNFDIGPVRLRNSIVALNTASNGPDLAGTMTSQGHNLIGKNGGTGFTAGTNQPNGDLVGTSAAPIDPRLGSLANNGGPTMTMALLPGSPAIDAGDNCVLTNTCVPALAAAITTDQRGAGFARSADGNGDGVATVDIGAYEVQGILVTNTADSGAGSLRQAIIDANANAGTDAINFNIPPGAPGCSGAVCTITLATALPNLSTSMSINGPGASQMTVQRSTAGGTPNFRIFFIQTGATANISGLTISGGNVTNDSGGGIFNRGTLTLTNSTVSGNTASGSFDSGGGIFNDLGTVTLTNSTVSSNTGTSGNPGSGNAFGGGIFNNAGTLTLTNSTVSGNTASAFASGGGIFNSSDSTLTVTNSTVSGNTGTSGGIFNGGTLTVTNSTVSGNNATSNNSGGIFNGGTLTVTNSTVSGNSAGVVGGGIFNGGGSANLKNTIVANNTVGSGGAGPDLRGTFNSQDNNLIGNTAGATFTGTTTHNITGQNPLLGPLQNNGGPTQTQALLPGSPAIDAGDNCVLNNSCSPALASAITTDQRGFTRSADGNGDGVAAVDIGAYEVQSILVPNTNDSGAGSLRQAIIDANANAGTDAINFNIPPGAPGCSGGVCTITLITALPDLSTSVIINGLGANLLTVQRSTVPGTPLFSLFSIAQNVTVTIAGLTLSNADSSQNGGAISNRGALTLDGLTLSNNHTAAGGSAIVNTSTGTVTLTNSTVSSNRSDIFAAVYNQGGTFNITNSTLTGNTNQGSAPGTAIFSESNSVTNVTNCTISQNVGQSVAIFQNSGGTGKVNLKNSIVSSNTGGDLSGTTNNGNNLIGGNPMLAPLGNYGGPTQTLALLPGSPAINAGDNCVVTNTCVPALAAPITTDQRGGGFNRIVNGSVDIGAFESRGFTISATSGTPQSAPINSAFGAPLLATVSGASGEPVAGGIVSFIAPASGPSVKFTGNVTTINATINASGQANASPTANGLAGGPYNITASSNGVASAASFSLTNTKAATTTALSSSLNPSNLAQSVTFTATVTSSAGTPTGTVQFKDNGTNLGSLMNLNASGVAQLTTSALTAGTHTITADYSGDANFASSLGTLSGGQIVNNRPLFSFSSATYSVSESTGSITITVNRTGDTSVAATVDYATDDTGALASCATVNGLASSRCDFTTAIGTLKFAAGEAQKTVTVLVNGDSYVEGPETFTVNLSNPTGGAGLITPSSATVTITDGPTGPPANLIDDARFFVRQHYHDFLNREPDQSGWDFWTNNINNCTPQPSCTEIQRINTSAAYFLSIEFQQTGYLVERMYKAAYGDASGMSTVGGAHQLNVPIVRFIEFLPDTQRIGQGVVVGQTGWEIILENNKQAFASEFVQVRFTAALPTSLTPAKFVNQLFMNAGVTPSTADRQTAINEFGSATNTSDVSARGRALRDVAENSILTQQEFNRAFVLMQYFGYLRRNPNDAPDSDYSGYDFWLTKLNFFNGNFVSAEMVKAFITSSEYRSRFGR